jgi:hypothetical protein
MWLPSLVYERLPQFFFLLGLLFVANGLYLGFDATIAFVYIGFGLWCCAYGVFIFVLRVIRRSRAVAHADSTPSATLGSEPVSE